MKRTAPRDASSVGNPCSRCFWSNVEKSSFVQRFGKGNVEMILISRSTADGIDPRTNMYQAPVFTDEYGLV